MNSIKSPYVVEVKAICLDPVPMTMEYMNFNFGQFNVSKRVHSLQQLLKFLSSNGLVKQFAWLSLKAAKDFAAGLMFLHSRNVVQRDLKPGNILVSNRNYCHIEDSDKLNEAWNNNPIICKLVDFRESRSLNMQRRTICHTVTQNCDIGTIGYMAPELFF